ncbi:sigma-70 family RNA polymerase sigma factor [Kordiimonas aestuarii]|uniref:sigma-70 family RNA polymerase sigma factor n=1 Tax=Kordiimonas aestuarii TaxID=1005925 RepID=UPI0021D229B3|nr:sigma-70 family RNA polymerase sigma factor [Kordiimonas aestuarii]
MRRLTGAGANAVLGTGQHPSGGVLDIFSARKDRAASHEELVGRIANSHDRAAFAELFAYYAPRLKSYLKALGLGDEKAEDLAQEVMVTLWRKAEKFDPAKARLSTWLFRVARNRFIDHTRRQKYAEVDVDDHLTQMVASDETDAPAMQNQNAIRVKAALKVLKPAQREVIELSFFKELSHSEIATKLSLPLGTVKSRIRIAFGALRKELRDMA